MELRERLAKVLEETGLNKIQLSKIAGVTHSSISHYFSGRSEGMRAATAARIEEATGVSARWLTTGKGPMMVSKPQKQERQTPAESTRVPIFTPDQARQFAPGGNIYSIGLIETWAHSLAPLSGYAFAIDVLDDSMSPDIQEGGLVIVDPMDLPVPGGFVAALADESIVIRRQKPRFNSLDGSPFDLLANNPAYPEISGASARIHVIGPVVEIRNYPERSGRALESPHFRQPLMMPRRKSDPPIP